MNDVIVDNIKTKPIVFNYLYISDKNIDELNSVLNSILDSINLSLLKDEISYIFRELIDNTKRALLKRAYFLMNNWDINNKKTYDDVMKHFLIDINKNRTYYENTLHKFSFNTQIGFHLKDRVFEFYVINNVSMTDQEKNRIANIFINFKKTRDILEAYTTLSNKEESAGLGIITSLMMLRHLGLDDSAYIFKSDDAMGKTKITIKIPLDSVSTKKAILISDDIAKEIDELPAFPENITHILNLICNEAVDFGRVAAIIHSDLGLTSDILRLVNSAQYMLTSKVSNILNALSFIGINGLKNLLYSLGVQKVFSGKYGLQEEIWEHAFRCASYAYKICRDKNLLTMADECYLGGLLHDIGKIVLKFLHPNLLDNIKKHCEDKGINEDIIEKLALGLSHATLGAEIVRKWNFPDSVISAIQFHHQPMSAPLPDKSVVYIVYMANILARLRESDIRYLAINKAILDYLFIYTEEQLYEYENNLYQYFEEQKESVLQDN